MTFSGKWRGVNHAMWRIAVSDDDPAAGVCADRSRRGGSRAWFRSPELTAVVRDRRPHPRTRRRRCSPVLTAPAGVPAAGPRPGGVRRVAAVWAGQGIALALVIPVPGQAGSRGSAVGRRPVPERREALLRHGGPGPYPPCRRPPSHRRRAASSHEHRSRPVAPTRGQNSSTFAVRTRERSHARLTAVQSGPPGVLLLTPPPDRHVF